MKIIVFLTLFVSLSFASLTSEIEEGVAFYKKKQYERALEVFDRVLINYPNSKRARLEYARVLYAMGRYEEAKKEFSKVLNQKIPPLVKKNIKWFLKKIEKKQKKSFWSGSVSIGTISDDNIENKSDNPMYGGFIDVNTEKRKDRYLTKEFNLQYKRKIKNGVWSNSLLIYDESDHDESKDKISYYSLSTAYRFMINGLRVSLPLCYGYTEVDKKEYMQSLTFKPGIDKKLSKRSMISYSLIIEKNDNKDNDERSTKVYGMSTKLLYKIKKFTNILGLEYKDYHKVTGDRIDVAKQRYGMNLGTSYSLLSSNNISLLYKKTRDIYKKKDPTIDDYRDDKTDKYNINFRQKVYKSLFFQLGFSKVENKSNLDIYSYDKNLYTFKVTQKF